MSHKTGYNVDNSVTGEIVSNINPVQYNGEDLLWYDNTEDAMAAANYFTNVTGVVHVVGGPRPKPHPHG